MSRKCALSALLVFSFATKLIAMLASLMFGRNSIIKPEHIPAELVRNVVMNLKPMPLVDDSREDENIFSLLLAQLEHGLGNILYWSVSVLVVTPLLLVLLIIDIRAVSTNSCCMLWWCFANKLIQIPLALFGFLFLGWTYALILVLLITEAVLSWQMAAEEVLKSRKHGVISSKV